MQVIIRFEDDDRLSALQLARICCDLQHLTTVLTSFPIDPDQRGRTLGRPFNPKYQEMIMADVPGGAAFFISEPALVARVRKSSPLTISVAAFCSLGGLASVVAIARMTSRIVLDLQNIRRARASADREEIRLIRDRLLLEKDYIKVRNALKSEIEREILDTNMLNAMGALVDGRHPAILRMNIRVPPLLSRSRK